MKLSLFENDKSTIKDELVLGLITIVSAAFGIFLVVARPSFWFVSGDDLVVFGVLFIVLALMYFPCLVYRIFENDYK